MNYKKSLTLNDLISCLSQTAKKKAIVFKPNDNITSFIVLNDYEKLVKYGLLNKYVNLIEITNGSIRITLY